MANTGNATGFAYTCPKCGASVVNSAHSCPTPPVAGDETRDEKALDEKALVVAIKRTFGDEVTRNEEANARYLVHQYLAALRPAPETAAPVAWQLLDARGAMEACLNSANDAEQCRIACDENLPEGAPHTVRPLYAAPPAPASGEQRAEVTDASRDVLAERERQKSVEGWTEAHDDAHAHGELAQAAACYAWVPPRPLEVKKAWPWDREWWKPELGDATSRRRVLVKAGALILAEIERLDRAALRARQGDK